ncbi:MAG: hypothetical protein NTV39_02620 [Candidatus Saccharibacteria bacterium]|nr:hypothetical protein [Candidatus Saccharibacteria bacterium]
MSAVEEFRSFMDDAESPILNLAKVRERAEAAFSELNAKAEREMKTIVHAAEGYMDRRDQAYFRTMLRNHFGPRADKLRS